MLNVGQQRQNAEGAELKNYLISRDLRGEQNIYITSKDKYTIIYLLMFFHTKTFTYETNVRFLPLEHGAPLRQIIKSRYVYKKLKLF